MLNQHPIFILILALFMVLIAIIDIFFNEKKEKLTLVSSLVLMFLNIISSVIYHKNIASNQEILKIFNIYILFNYGVFLIYFSRIFIFSVSKMRQYNLITNSIKNTKWNAYFVVDQKNKIKDISDSFLNQLNLKIEDVKGKNIFDILDKSMRFLKFNGVEITNKEIKKFYLSYKKNVKINSVDKRELIVLNAYGEQIILNFVEQPIFYFNKYRGRMNVGEIKTDFNMLNVEKELLKNEEELNSIKNKFTATFELITTALIYYDLNEKYIWGNDKFKELLKINGNTITIEEYLKKIHPDDFKKYNEKLQSLSLENSSYAIKYRILVEKKYIWIKENLKRIYENKNENIMASVLEEINNEHYLRTNMPILDNILCYNDLLLDVDKLFEFKRPFYLVCFRLSNIPQLNELYSREFGNMAMSEYIKKINLNFVSELSNVYRISGIDFVLTITDFRKMELFKKALTTDFDSLNLQVIFGAITEKIRVNVGISTGLKDTNDNKRLLEIAKKALSISMNTNYKNDYCFSEEL